MTRFVDMNGDVWNIHTYPRTRWVAFLSTPDGFTNLLRFMAHPWIMNPQKRKEGKHG